MGIKDPRGPDHVTGHTSVATTLVVYASERTSPGLTVVVDDAAKRENPVTVRKSGARRWPWEARCRVHRASRDGENYFGPDGAVAFNTVGIGNRTWDLAMQAAEGYLRAFHADEGVR